jgi:hypothetical protein
MQVDFLIDTTSHKRWVLPDGEHVMNSVIYGDTLSWSIWPRGWGPAYVKQSGHIDITKPDWEDLWELCQKLANKKYPRDPLREARRARWSK